MQTKAFKKLKIGDQVTLAAARSDYSCGHKTPDERIYIPAGTIGTIGAVGVPYVTGKEGRTFVCVDFKFRPAFQDCDGKPVEHWQRKDLEPNFRCAANAEQLV